MKFIAVVAALATTALAQSIAIGVPAAGSNIFPGESLNVEVDLPQTLTGTREVAIAIGLLSCNQFGGDCGNIDVSQDLGTILFSGDYNPQLSDPSKPPFQHFSVPVPVSLPIGTASLNVAHFSLVGAGPEAFFEVKNITLNVVPGPSVAGRRLIL
ncbi:hypothetical protein NLI96_g1283 [Meripilus lineatus]|uniref:Uncharacterized protein n=1 Tax=Meripilus lineatus TaxID=2056292 RepID=A0AAD5VAT8_9APHY|nr:hypothetical protein NLI96_g1283 [Physisporinus lineatus]